jgi:methyl-accepting chemotaxis protein
MHLSIRGKLLVAFGAVFVLMTAIGLSGLRYTQSLESEFASLYDNNLAGAIYLANAQDGLWQLRYGFPQYMVATTPAARKTITDDEARLVSLVETNLAAYQKLNITPEEKQSLTGLLDIWAKYFAARPKWFELYGAGQIEEAATWRAATTTPFGAANVKAFSDQIALQRTVAAARQQSVLESARNATTTLIGLMVLGLVVSVAAVYALTRSIATPARQMAHAAAGLAEGELDQHITLHSRDELGQAADAFRAMIGYQRGMAEVARAVAAGDLTHTVEPKSERDELGTAFRSMIADLRVLVGAVQH